MHSPLYTNSPAGFATELVTFLWDGAKQCSDPLFSQLDSRVMRDTSFPCVILGRMEFGVLALDCCDSSSWTLEGDGIDLYIKLQFDPTTRYPRKVIPFTYIPQHPNQFERDADRFRQQYLATPKNSLAWGRFIAVSLDRFHLAHQMRRMAPPEDATFCAMRGTTIMLLIPSRRDAACLLLIIWIR